MPVRWIGAQEGAPSHWLLAGRVLARPDDDTLLLAVGDLRLRARGAALQALQPGDLARVRATLKDPREPYLASSAEVVFRPRRSPFDPGSETSRFDARGVRARLALRAEMTERVRASFRGEGFLEVETPLMVTSPGLDLHLSAFEASGHPGSSPTGIATHFGYLITSPEYHMKRLLVGGVERCFQLARCARAGELGRRHQPEFTMLEWYRAWATLDDVLDDAERAVRVAASALPPGPLRVGGLSLELQAPFARLTVREAFALYAPDVGDPIALANQDEEAYFEALSTRVEPRLGRDRPTFLTRFPARHASLAKLAEDDPTVCERGELYLAGVELSNGFLELTDPTEQRARFLHDQQARALRGYPVYPIDEAFLAALEEGLPPSAGNALGFDRLVALLLGQDDLAEVIAFPHHPR